MAEFGGVHAGENGVPLEIVPVNRVEACVSGGCGYGWENGVVAWGREHHSGSDEKEGCEAVRDPQLGSEAVVIGTTGLDRYCARVFSGTLSISKESLLNS